MNGWRGTWLWRALMVAWSALSVVVVSLTCCLMAPILGARRAFFGIGKWWIRQQFFLSGVKWSVSGWEDLPVEIREERQPVIFMCNHASLLDPPFLTYIIPIPAVYIAKKEVRWMPGVGWAVWAAGMIFIDRKNRERAIQSLKVAAQKIRGGKNVVIFPEGTRTRSGQLLPFKKGGFNLAMDAGVPIVPLAIDGTFEVFPPGAKMMRPGTVRARFGQPLSPEDYPTRDALMEEVRHRIVALLEDLKAQPLQGDR